MKSSKKIVVLGRIAFFVALLIAFFCFAAEAFVAGGVVIAATIVALTVLARVFGLSDRTEDAAGSNVPPRLESDRIWQDYYNSASPLYTEDVRGSNPLPPTNLGGPELVWRQFGDKTAAGQTNSGLESLSCLHGSGTPSAHP